MAALIGQAESLRFRDEWEPVAGGFGAEDRGESREPRAQELPPHLEKWAQAEWPPVNARRRYISQLCASGLLRRECQNHQARNKRQFFYTNPKTKRKQTDFPHISLMPGRIVRLYSCSPDIRLGFSGVALGWDDL